MRTVESWNNSTFSRCTHTTPAVFRNSPSYFLDLCRATKFFFWLQSRMIYKWWREKWNNSAMSHSAHFYHSILIDFNHDGWIGRIFWMKFWVKWMNEWMSGWERWRESDKKCRYQMKSKSIYLISPFYTDVWKQCE